LCPQSLGSKTPQQLLNSSEPVGDKRYAIHDGKAFCAQQDGCGNWHGYPVGWKEVPFQLQKKWMKEEFLTRADRKRYLEEHK
jgi:hypothetical protein